jgi:hypothetical protein
MRVGKAKVGMTVEVIDKTSAWFGDVGVVNDIRTKAKCGPVIYPVKVCFKGTVSELIISESSEAIFKHSSLKKVSSDSKSI